MKNLLLTIAAIFIISVSFGQNLYFTKTGHAYFMSHTDAIDIDGNNKQMTSFFNQENGEVVFQMLIKSFKFELATAEEHFNETYMESDKFPKAKFKGNITNMDEIDFSKDGTYTANIKGEMTIHGVTKNMEQSGKVTITGGEISASSAFQISIADYKIKVPKMVKERVAETVDVKVDLVYELYQK